MVLFRQTIGVIVVLAFGGLGIWAFILGVQEEPAILGSVATAFTGLVIFGLQQRGQRQDAIREARNEQLSPMYEGLTKLVRTIGSSDGSSSARKRVERDAERTLGDFQDKLLVWGPTPVIREWANAMRIFQDKPDSRIAMVAYASILFVIRDALGAEDDELDVRDLLRLFVTDIDDHLPEGTQSQVMAWLKKSSAQATPPQ